MSSLYIILLYIDDTKQVHFGFRLVLNSIDNWYVRCVWIIVDCRRIVIIWNLETHILKWMRYRYVPLDFPFRCWLKMCKFHLGPFLFHGKLDRIIETYLLTEKIQFCANINLNTVCIFKDNSAYMYIYAIIIWYYIHNSKSIFGSL